MTPGRRMTFFSIVNEVSCMLEHEMPRCPHCGGLARLNTLMFGDRKPLGKCTERQERELTTWLSTTYKLFM